MKKITKTKAPHQSRAAPGHLDTSQPFIEHVYELRRRLFYIAASVVVLGIGGYFIQEKLVSLLLKPAQGQQFIYTSPGGGINFLFQICIYFGLTLSVPLIIYHLLRYIEPLVRQRTRRLLGRYAVASIMLASIGVGFGYFVGLPAALNFLSRQFTTVQIEPLLTIQEYMSFVTIYLLGSALLFQIPLILSFINRIRPLKPSKLLKFERYWILIAFIVAAIITPTPDIFNQLLFAGPIIIVYQVGIILVLIQNRASRRKIRKVAHLPVYEIPPMPTALRAEPWLSASSDVFLTGKPLAPQPQRFMDANFRPRPRALSPLEPIRQREPKPALPYTPRRVTAPNRGVVWDILDPYMT